MSPQDERTLRAMRRGIRSVLLLAVLTVGAILFNRHGFYPPHGNPLIYTLAMSWLISFTVALPITAVFAVFKVGPRLFSLARWEKEGRVYDRWSVRAFRWVLVRSPLGWINANLYLTTGRTDCERLLREMSFGERVHWLTGLLSIILAISWLVGGYAEYGSVMLLVRIPFDLYPIMLLRRNRARVGRVLSRQLRASG